jgi:hypothetical protein
VGILGRWRSRKDRRRAARIGGPALTAFYWTGGVPEPVRVRDISGRGAFIETKTDWCAGTLIHVVLEHEGSESSPKVSFARWARIVRNVDGGKGMQFLELSRVEEMEFQRFLKVAAERRAGASQ